MPFPAIGPLLRQGLVCHSSSLKGLLQERRHLCGCQVPGRSGGDAWRHRCSHFGESELRLNLFNRKDKRELNSSAVRRGLKRSEEISTVLYEGSVFLFVVKQDTSLALKKNLSAGLPWR